MKRHAVSQKQSKRAKIRKVAPVGDYQKGRELARTPKQELKAFDIAKVGTALMDAGAGGANIPVVNQMINGAELYQRVGRKVYMKSLHFRGYFLNTATTVQDFARVIIYFDAQPNGAAPTLPNVIQDSNAAAGTEAMSEINLTNRQRFKILRDHQVILPACTNTAGVLTNLDYPDSSGTLSMDFFIKLKGLETVYNGTNGGTIADITSGAIGMYFFTDNVNNAWNINWQTRLRYYD